MSETKEQHEAKESNADQRRSTADHLWDGIHPLAKEKGLP